MGYRSGADGTMSLQTTRQVLLVFLVAAASACVSTELSTGAEDPANPRAPAQPPPPASSALQPNFEPFAAYGVDEGSEASNHDHGAHGHGETNSEGAPAAPAPVSPPAGRRPQTRPGGDAPSPQAAPSSAPEATDGRRAAPPQKKKVKKPQYTCPMHPEVKSPEPGRCPKCGMPLVLEKQKAP